MAMLALLFALTAGPQASAPPADLLKAAMDPNPELRSYVASATLSATLHAPLPLTKTFSGTAYFLKPKQKIVFDNVSGPLRRFRELTATLPSYEQAQAEYTITPASDDGTTSVYKLVPSKPGRRVLQLVIEVDDRSMLITDALWTYTGGGRLHFVPTYVTIGAFRLQAAEAISARFPDYSADGTLRLFNYQINAAVPPAIFGSN